MSKFRVFYIISVLILGALLVLSVFRPMAADAKYSEVQRRQLLQMQDQWILQFDILNHEDEDVTYTIYSTAGDRNHVQSVTIKAGGMFNYMQRIYPESMSEKILSFAVYKEGEDTPFEKATYHFE